MSEKIKIITEMGRADISAIFFLMGEELTDELWKKLSENSISIDWNKFEKDVQKNMKIALISMVAIMLDIK